MAASSSARELAEVRVRDVGHDEADRRGAAEAQGAGERVRSVVQLGGGGQHAFAGGRRDVARSVVEDVADDGGRGAGELGDVASGGHASLLSLGSCLLGRSGAAKRLDLHGC
jgi:hypothetical protein